MLPPDDQRVEPFVLGDAETLLDALVRHAGDCVMVLDLDGRVVRWNAVCEDTFGWTAPEVLGEVLPHVATDLRLRAFADLRAVAGGDRVVERDIESLRKDGTRVLLHAVLIPVSDTEGFASGVMVVSRDLTADGRLSRQRDEFAALTGRRLREPLAGMAASAQLLARPEIAADPERRTRISSVIAAQSADAVRFIDDMLVVLQLREGSIRLQREVVDIGALVADIASRMSARTGGRVLVDFEPESPSVRGDRRRLAHALQGLVECALLASPPASPVEVSVGHDDVAAIIEIADRGAPIEPAERDRVFDVFYDGPDPRGRASGGLPLGLAKAIVTAHGGTLTAGRRAGGGALFTLRIPSGRTAEESGGPHG